MAVTVAPNYYRVFDQKIPPPNNAKVSARNL